MRTSLAFAFCLAGPAMGEAPLSAIDWLSQSVTPVAQPVKPKPVEPAVTSGAVPEDISVSVIGGPNPDAVGLLSPQLTGLPRNLWGLGSAADIAALITAERADTLPALRQLLVTLLLAEADAPVDSENGAVLRTRVDKLLDLGALDQADALMTAAGAADAELFRRAFDVALLTGNEDRACRTMKATASLAPTFPARIFCLARSGDWNAAALSLRTGVALGQISPEEDILLARFLDAEAEPDAPPPVPQRLTPLAWRMFEAIGEPLPTANLPVAFAHVDLSDRAGWKAQIEAAERLARVGAIAPNQLLGLYTERDPAASGGVWDRVAAFQDFDAAMQARDPVRIEKTMTVVWPLMETAELEVPFATLYGERLDSVTLTGEVARQAYRIGLLSPGYERTAKAYVATDVADLFLQGLARGSVEGLVAPDSLGRAIAPAFVLAEPSDDSLKMLEDGRLGEAILMAIDQVSMGVQGELRGVTDGLALLRHVGLEDVARRTALQLMLLERRG